MVIPEQWGCKQHIWRERRLEKPPRLLFICTHLLVVISHKKMPESSQVSLKLSFKVSPCWPATIRCGLQEVCYGLLANVFHRLKFKNPFPRFAAILKAVKPLGGDPAGDRLLKTGLWFHQDVTATAMRATILDGATLPCLDTMTSHKSLKWVARLSPSSRSLRLSAIL